MTSSCRFPPTNTLDATTIRSPPFQASLQPRTNKVVETWNESLETRKFVVARSGGLQQEVAGTWEYSNSEVRSFAIKERFRKSGHDTGDWRLRRGRMSLEWEGSAPATRAERY